MLDTFCFFQEEKKRIDSLQDWFVQKLTIISQVPECLWSFCPTVCRGHETNAIGLGLCASTFAPNRRDPTWLGPAHS